MAKITKSYPVRQPSNIFFKDLLASHVAIDNSDKTVLNHINDEMIHMTQKEKDTIKDIVKNGAGINEEDYQKILDLINRKADANHTHDKDENFFILATQVVETEDRKFASKAEKDSLAGVTGNIQGQINILKTLSEEAMKFKGRYNNYASMLAANPNPNIGDTTFIDNDETQEEVSTIYYFKDNKWLRIKKDKQGTSNAGWIASNVPPSDRNLLWVDISKVDPALKWHNGASWTDISGLKTVPASKVIQEKNLHFVSDKDITILDKINEDTDTGFLMYNGVIIGGGGSTGANIDDTKVDIDTTFSSFKIKGELDKKQPLLGFVPENTSNKGAINGYASLDEEAKVPRANIYESKFVVQNEEERLKLTDMVNGDICYEESTTKAFIYSSGEWQLLSKGDAVVIGRNNFLAERNPTKDDDERHGYLPGSTWINKYTKKAFICTDSSISSAQWELMAGQVTLNIGEIIPFKVDINNVIEESGKFLYAIPTVNLITDFVEITLNGNELMQEDQYLIESIVDKDGVGHNYLALDKKLNEDDHLYGEIYKQDVKKAEEQMIKSVYDSNNNGKIDFAEISDFANGIPDWQPLTRYEKKQLILKDNCVFVSLQGHTSAITFEADKWKVLISEANNLDKFDTDDLKESAARKYLSAEEKINVGQLPGVFTNISNNTRQVSISKSDISSLKSITQGHTNRLDNFKFTQLKDTPSFLSRNAYLRVNGDGSGITQITDPTFPIKSIIDSSGIQHNNINVLKFKNMQMTKETSGTFTYELRANAIELMDMPKAHEHGKVLVSDVNNQKFVLANKEDLTMSIENFTKSIELDEWEEVDGHFEATVFHNMSSEALVVSFTDESKIEDKHITYKIVDKNNIKVFSDSNKLVNCTINCALGAGNGYWQYLMDWSKIDFVDDSRIRDDRAYSSLKMSEILKNYAVKNDYYTKKVSDTRFASIDFEHNHNNKSTLDDLSVNSEGDLIFKNVRLLTEMNATTVSLEDITDHQDLTEQYNYKTLCTDNNLQAIIASELVIKNLSNKDASFKVRDGSMDILTVKLSPNEIQKYHLGISNKIKVFTQGNVKTMLTISAF